MSILKQPKVLLFGSIGSAYLPGLHRELGLSQSAAAEQLVNCIAVSCIPELVLQCIQLGAWPGATKGFLRFGSERSAMRSKCAAN